MARGDSLSRQWKLMQLLEDRQEVAVPEVAQELGAAVRTVYRDLVVLERFGVPIYPEKRGSRSRWRVMEGYRKRLSLTLSWPELVALHASRELVAASAGSFFHQAVTSALEKIVAAVPNEVASRVAETSRNVSAEAGARREGASTRHFVEALIEAIERKQTVRISYRAPHRQATSSRTLDPHHLHLHLGATYVLGYVHEHQEIRTYLVDRIRSVAPTGQRFARIASFRPQDLVHGSLGPWNGRSAKVRLRFSARAAPYVSEKKIHPTQSFQQRSDGTADVSLLVPLAPALSSWILGFGPEVTVVSPRSLARRIREAHLAAGKLDAMPASIGTADRRRTAVTVDGRARK